METTVVKGSTINGAEKPSDAPTKLLASSNGEPITGADIFVRSLEAEGVKVVFGHPGGAVIAIYDAIAKIQPSFQHVLVRHEQGGAHAAAGYAKATGKVGTVLVTSGPGATNTVTGIADAYMDSIGIVVFTGQVPTHLIGNDAFQECDTIGVTRSITKHSFLVRDVKDLASTIRAAYHLAGSGRPGPVVVDLPKDVQLASFPFEYPAKVPIRGYHEVPPPVDTGRIERAAKMISEAKQPVLYVGGGAVNSGAADMVTELAHKASIPVTTTLHGLGAFPASDPLYMGMLGMHGTWYANQAIQNSDLIIAIGARFDDRVTGKLEAWAPNAKIIHFEIDPTSISKNVYADLAIVGDARKLLDSLIPLVDEVKHDAWLARIDEWRAECPLTYEDDGALRPQQILRRLRDKTGGNAIVLTDVGQNQMWTAQFFDFEHPRTHITSGGLGTMGFSFPASIGAALGARELGLDMPVISINGDGGFLMNAQELGVAAAAGLPIKVIIFNNNFLGMVRQWQELFHQSRYSHTDLTSTNPDFVKLAEAHHCVGLRANSPDQIDDVLDEAWAVTDRPVVIEFQVVKEEMVFPMVPAGAASDEMITKRLTPNAFV